MLKGKKAKKIAAFVALVSMVIVSFNVIRVIVEGMGRVYSEGWGEFDHVNGAGWLLAAVTIIGVYFIVWANIDRRPSALKWAAVLLVTYIVYSGGWGAAGYELYDPQQTFALADGTMIHPSSVMWVAFVGVSIYISWVIVDAFTSIEWREDLLAEVLPRWFGNQTA